MYMYADLEGAMGWIVHVCVHVCVHVNVHVCVCHCVQSRYMMSSSSPPPPPPAPDGFDAVPTCKSLCLGTCQLTVITSSST